MQWSRLFPPSTSFPLVGSILALAKFPASPGSFAWGNLALFSYSFLSARACVLRDTPSGQGTKHGSNERSHCCDQVAPSCRWGSPPMLQGAWRALRLELLPQLMLQAASRSSLPFCKHSHSKDRGIFSPATDRWHIEFTLSKRAWAVWIPSCQGYHMILLFTSSLFFKHWQKQLMEVCITDSTCTLKSAEDLKVHYIYLKSESSAVGKGTGLALFREKFQQRFMYPDAVVLHEKIVGSLVPVKRPLLKYRMYQAQGSVLWIADFNTPQKTKTNPNTHYRKLPQGFSGFISSKTYE